MVKMRRGLDWFHALYRRIAAKSNRDSTLRSGGAMRRRSPVRRGALRAGEEPPASPP